MGGLYATGVLAGDPSCGTTIAIKVCEIPDHPKRPVRHSCGRSSCEICWPTWANRAAERIADLLQGYSEASGTLYPPWHITISPDDAGLYSESSDTMRQLTKKARKMVEVLGVKGCVVIIHGYRIKKEKMREVNDGATSAGVNRYRWCFDQDRPRDYLYFSPHFHLLGWGYLMQSDDFHEQTGWIYKKHKTRPLSDMEKTAYYLLSHAWLFGTGTNAYRYWGALSPTRLGVKRENSYQIEKCTICGRPLHRLPVTLEGEILVQDIANSPTSKILIETRRYFIRKKRGPPSTPFVRAYIDQDNYPDDGLPPWLTGGTKAPN